jgi:hypothetical protein
VRRACGALFLAIPLLASCSSDVPPAPEPDIKNIGAFTAYGVGELSLIRTLQTISLDNDYVIFATIYDVAPTSFDEARALAQLPSLPVRQGLTTGSEKLLLAQPHSVVWFRTLTKAEADLGL